MSDQSKLSRREFIKDAAMGAAAVAGAGVLGATPAQAQTPAQPWLPAKWDYEAEVVVVGYGGAGASAAIAATDAGAKVLVLDKAPTPDGGNTGCSGGNARLPKPEKEAIDYLRAECWGTVTDEELLAAHTRATNAVPAWVEKLGNKGTWVTAAAAVPNSLTGSTTLDATQEWGIAKADGTRGAGAQLFAFLHSVATARKIPVMQSTPVKELVQDPVTKEILGVKAITGVTFAKDLSSYTGGKEIYVKASKGVVLACGGFENNPDMVHQSLKDGAQGWPIPFMGTPYNTGDGFPMVQRVGAQLWHMNCAEMQSVCVKLPSEQISHMANPGPSNLANVIWVNRYGKRFMNEVIHWSHTKRLGTSVFAFDHKVKVEDPVDFADYPNIPFYMIFDDTLMKAGPLSSVKTATMGYSTIQKLYTWSDDNSAELAKGWIVKADTIKELAAKIVAKDFFGRTVGMDVAGLEKTVSDFNSYCAAGKDPDYARDPKKMTPIKTPPFYAMELTIGMLNTDGGPVHNKFAQTLGFDGKPIPRLYSAGEFGSIYGFLYLGGGNVAEALGMGRVAGEQAAGLKPWDVKA